MGKQMALMTFSACLCIKLVLLLEISFIFRFVAERIFFRLDDVFHVGKIQHFLNKQFN